MATKKHKVHTVFVSLCFFVAIKSGSTPGRAGTASSCASAGGVHRLFATGFIRPFGAVIGEGIARQSVKGTGIGCVWTSAQHEHFDEAADICTIASQYRAFFALLVAGCSTHCGAALCGSNTFWGRAQAIIIDDEHIGTSGIVYLKGIF